MNRAWLLLAAAALALGAAAAHAQPWGALSPAQRQALEPLRDDWSRLSPDQQQKWLAIANRFGSLPPDERQRLQRRMDNWVQMSPGQRDLARQNYQEAQRYGDDDRRARWEAYQALPPERRNELARGAQADDRRSPPPPRRAPRDADDAGGGGEREGRKSNLVRPLPEAAPQRIAPSVVQARPGATTRLLSQPAQPPAHQQAGLPKIAATPGFVEPRTLLPQRGAQGAAVVSPPPRDARRRDDKNKQR
jgi:hypothetical protein